MWRLTYFKFAYVGHKQDLQHLCINMKSWDNISDYQAMKACLDEQLQTVRFVCLAKQAWHLQL